ncbi:MAG: DUF6502 family protein [Myxococcota bacterium]
MAPRSSQNPEPSGQPSGALLGAVERLLAPLVRLLLDHQIPFPTLAGLLKRIYVDEAERGYALPDRPQTISRLTLLTGIHRKDVKRLQSEAADHTPATPPSVSLGAQLVLRWTADPAYRDEDGRARALPRLATGDGSPSFDGLVQTVTQDIRPRAVLDEWLRLGIARVDASDRVILVEDAFIPSEGFEEKAYYLGRNVRDHLAAARHNLSGEGAPLLERSVYYANLRPESVEELQALAREAGVEALQRVNERARALQAADDGEPDARQRMSFGAWFFRAVQDEEAHETAPAADAGDGDD